MQTNQELNHTEKQSTHFNQNNKHWLRKWGLLLILVLSLGYYYISLFGAQKKSLIGTPQNTQNHEAAKVPTVKTVAVLKTDISLYFNGLGTITPLNTVTVRSRVDGHLNKIWFRDGQMVKNGELLAEIDARAFQLQLNQLDAQLKRDEVILQNALIDVTRYRDLYKEKSIAKQQLDAQESLVRQYQATIKVDQAQIESARLQLSYCQITAPINGRIGLRQVDSGNLIRAADQNGLGVITQMQPIAMLFSIPESYLPNIMKSLRTGINLSVEAWTSDNTKQLAEGSLLSVDNQIDSSTGTIKLKAQFSNQDEMLFPNQAVIARLRLNTLRNALTLPLAAIQNGNNGAFVYLLTEEQTVKIRTVRVKANENQTAVIEDGINAGDLVVIDGVDKLREGIRVKVINK